MRWGCRVEAGLPARRASAASSGAGARWRRWRAAARLPSTGRRSGRPSCRPRSSSGISGASRARLIAELLELPASSVYRLLRERGVLRSRGAARPVRRGEAPPAEVEPGVVEVLPAELAEEAVARYEAGEAPRVIGLALGVSASRVYRVLKQWGVVRSRSEAARVRHERRRGGDEARNGRDRRNARGIVALLCYDVLMTRLFAQPTPIQVTADSDGVPQGIYWGGRWPRSSRSPTCGARPRPGGIGRRRPQPSTSSSSRRTGSVHGVPGHDE